MIHGDEAKENALKAIAEYLESEPIVGKALLIDDIMGQLRLVLWTIPPDSPSVERLQATLASEECAGRYWTREIWFAEKAQKTDLAIYDDAWGKARDIDGDRLRILARRRNRGFWFVQDLEPPWEAPERIGGESPPIVVFHSFKGGVGRSTAVAAVAIQRALRGEKVVVVDADLEAPGLGTLLASQDEGSTARWGLADFLLERALGPVEIRDYYHAFRDEDVVGKGEILVVPAGHLDSSYLEKLARLDLEPPPTPKGDLLVSMLLKDIRDELKPHWILLDGRAGLSDPSGMLLAGVGHLHVLFGTSSEQSWQGMRLVIERLGAERIRIGKPQRDCLVVQAMVAQGMAISKSARDAFADRARDEFALHYYTEKDSDEFWSMFDIENSDAPHAPVAIFYQERLSHFGRIHDVADLLSRSEDYSRLTERISTRFGGTGE